MEYSAGIIHDDEENLTVWKENHIIFLAKKRQVMNDKHSIVTFLVLLPYTRIKKIGKICTTCPKYDW